jgi:hypothetical protein
MWKTPSATTTAFSRIYPLRRSGDQATKPMVFARTA